MEIHQLKTFVAVAREGSITRAAERLYLSQPAVSAHIKAIEDTLGVALFERTPRGMSLTGEGQRLLAKAEQTLGAHRELLEEAARIRGRLSGRLRLGAGSNASAAILGRLLTELSGRHPELEVALRQGSSVDILDGIRNGSLDAGFYNESGEPEPDLAAIEVSRFDIYLAAPPGLVAAGQPPDWRLLADLPWIGPAAGTCCGRAAEHLFQRHQFRPGRMISIDREDVTRTLVAGGVGLGLLHADTAQEAEARGEVALVCEVQKAVRVLFVYRADRLQDPLLGAVAAILCDGAE